MIQTTQFMAAYRLFLCNYLQENLSSNTSIVLSSPLRHVALSNDPNVVGYTQNQPELDAVCRSLPRAQKEYEMQLFAALFDFRRMVTLVEQMKKMAKEAVSFHSVDC